MFMVTEILFVQGNTDKIWIQSKGVVAQSGERVVRNDKVGGSIPPGSTSQDNLSCEL